MSAKKKAVTEVSDETKLEAPVVIPSGTLVQPEVGLIPQEVFQGKVSALRELSTIRNDKGDEIDFDGQAKEDFVVAFEEGYPVLQKTLTGLYELGTFLHGVRTRLKPHKLYHSWLDYAGIPRGTAQSYVQAYERYRDRLPRFASLGIRKLLIASRLPNCADYVESHEHEIASKTTEELEKEVRELRQRKAAKKTKVGRKPTYFSVGSYRIRPSLDGNKITIEGMTKDEQKDFLDSIKELLSRKKG